jgi:hypothetical protein
MDNFSNFLYSFGAARKLLDRAHSTGSLIEGLVLYVSLIDGLLRAALILDKQLQDNSADFDFSYIEQKQTGPKYTEKQVYEEAYKRNLIDAVFKAKIIDLYERRNAVIHLFFLTSLKYADLGPWLDSYEEIYHHCYQIVDELEARQLREDTGMTRTGPKADRRRIREAINMKLGVALSQVNQDAGNSSDPDA